MKFTTLFSTALVFVGSIFVAAIPQDLPSGSDLVSSTSVSETGDPSSFSILPISTSSKLSSTSSGSVSATGSASILPISVSSTTSSTSASRTSSESVAASSSTVSQAGVLPTALAGIEKLVAAVMVGLAGVAML